MTDKDRERRERDLCVLREPLDTHHIVWPIVVIFNICGLQCFIYHSLTHTNTGVSHSDRLFCNLSCIPAVYLVLSPSFCPRIPPHFPWNQRCTVLAKDHKVHKRKPDPLPSPLSRVTANVTHTPNSVPQVGFHDELGAGRYEIDGTGRINTIMTVDLLRALFKRGFGLTLRESHVRWEPQKENKSDLVWWLWKSSR